MLHCMVWTDPVDSAGIHARMASADFSSLSTFRDAMTTLQPRKDNNQNFW